MKFDVYGRFQLEVIRHGDEWRVYRVGSGTRVFTGEIVVPTEVTAEEIATYLDDLFHEGAVPGKRVTRLPD